MARIDEMAQDIKKLERYFQNDGIFSVDYEEEAGHIKVAMYKERFAKKFNLWNTDERDSQIRIYRFVDGVEFYSYVPKDEYKEFIEGIDF